MSRKSNLKLTFTGIFGLILVSILLSGFSCRYHVRNRVENITGVELTDDLYYLNDDMIGIDPDPDKHRLDVYRPTTGENLPVFIFIHGGSWSFGDKAWYKYLGYAFAKQGLVTVIASYRLAPHNKYPAQVLDVVNSLNYTYHNVDNYNGNPDNIFICGHSAGAQLASLVVLNKKYNEMLDFDINKISGLILISGPYLLSEEFLIKERYSRLARKVFTENKDIWHEASPFYFVNRDAPDTLVCYAENDWLEIKYQAKIFYRKFKKLNNRVSIIEIPTKNHYSEIIFFQFKEDPLHRAVMKFIKERTG